MFSEIWSIDSFSSIFASLTAFRIYWNDILIFDGASFGYLIKNILLLFEKYDTVTAYDYIWLSDIATSLLAEAGNWQVEFMLNINI